MYNTSTKNAKKNIFGQCKIRSVNEVLIGRHGIFSSHCCGWTWIVWCETWRYLMCECSEETSVTMCKQLTTAWLCNVYTQEGSVHSHLIHCSFKVVNNYIHPYVHYQFILFPPALRLLHITRHMMSRRRRVTRIRTNTTIPARSAVSSSAVRPSATVLSSSTSAWHNWFNIITLYMKCVLNWYSYVDSQLSVIYDIWERCV